MADCAKTGEKARPGSRTALARPILCPLLPKKGLNFENLMNRPFIPASSHGLYFVQKH